VLLHLFQDQWCCHPDSESACGAANLLRIAEHPSQACAEKDPDDN
jgi:hypothetical protein